MAMLLRCIDFETSGLPGEGSTAAICEIGWCDVVVHLGDPVPGAIQCSVGDRPQAFFCNPGHPIPPEIRAVHHIGDADVADAISPAEGLKVIGDMKPDYYVAHNAPFEAAFFPDSPREIICTYRAAVRLWPDAPGHSNQILRYVLGLDLDSALAMPPHRAGPDAYVTAHLLARILESGPSIEDLVRWSSGPPLLPRVMFGNKHRGQKWEDVPTDYIRWIVDKSDLSHDIKANARHHLKLRATAK